MRVLFLVLMFLCVILLFAVLEVYRGEKIHLYPSSNDNPGDTRGNALGTQEGRGQDQGFHLRGAKSIQKLPRLCFVVVLKVPITVKYQCCDHSVAPAGSRRWQSTYCLTEHRPSIICTKGWSESNARRRRRRPLLLKYRFKQTLTVYGILLRYFNSFLLHVVV